MCVEHFDGSPVVRPHEDLIIQHLPQFDFETSALIYNSGVPPPFPSSLTCLCLSSACLSIINKF